MANILRKAFGVDHTFKLGNTRGDHTNYLPELITAARNPEMHIFLPVGEYRGNESVILTEASTTICRTYN